MAGIKSTQTNAVAISKVYKQEDGDLDWVDNTPSIDYKLPEISITSTNTDSTINNSTNTALKTDKVINEGDLVRLYNSNDGLVKGSLGSVTTADGGSIYRHDIFGDNSAVATYQLDGDATDLGGNYNGTDTDVTYGTGKYGDAVDYNNVDATHYIVTSDKIARNGSNEITISGWINVYGHTGNWLNVWHLSPDNDDSSGNSRQPAVWLYGDDNTKFHIKNDGVSTENLGITESKGAITYGDWHHITQVVTKRQMKFYIDGELTDTFDSSEDFKFNDGYLYIGDKWYGKNFLIDQVRIFNRALTDDEIKQLYQEQ